MADPIDGDARPWRCEMCGGEPEGEAVLMPTAVDRLMPYMGYHAQNFEGTPSLILCKRCGDAALPVYSVLGEALPIELLVQLTTPMLREMVRRWLAG